MNELKNEISIVKDHEIRNFFIKAGPYDWDYETGFRQKLGVDVYTKAIGHLLWNWDTKHLQSWGDSFLVPMRQGATFRGVLEKDRLTDFLLFVFWEKTNYNDPNDLLKAKLNTLLAKNDGIHTCYTAVVVAYKKFREYYLENHHLLKVKYGEDGEPSKKVYFDDLPSHMWVDISKQLVGVLNNIDFDFDFVSTFDNILHNYWLFRHNEEIKVFNRKQDLNAEIRDNAHKYQNCVFCETMDQYQKTSNGILIVDENKNPIKIGYRKAFHLED